MKIPGELRSSIFSGNCVLFVGSGASTEADAPSAQEIARELSRRYLHGQHQDEPLSKIAAYIEADPKQGRKLVVDYLMNRLSRLQPSKTHLLLPKFDWAAIYTTNYDTLLEQTYAKIGIKCKSIRSSRDLTADTNDKSHYVMVSKLHGCISKPFSEETPLVITEDDYYSAANNRKAILRQLEVHRYRSIFLFIGYSFSDLDLSQIWFDVAKELGEFSQGAYALWPNCSEAQRLMWRSRHVELIDAGFREFMKELSSLSSRELSGGKLPVNYTAPMEFAKVLLLLLGMKDPATKEHSWRVLKLATMLAEEMAVSCREHQSLEIAALLHDVGFIAIPDSVLHKQNPLSLTEWQIIQKHPIIGEQILVTHPKLRRIAQIVRCHHESYDGNGYPDGLAGRDIPRPARIIAVADHLDALTHERPYRRSIVLAQAVDYVRRSAAVQFDPVVVSALDKVLAGKKLTGV